MRFACSFLGSGHTYQPTLPLENETMSRCVLFPVIAFLLLQVGLADERPNILWITCEDTNPHLGSYGDEFAVTPRLDAFAHESVRYTQAFAYTGACSPSRSCLITGVYPLRLGTHPMRSNATLPKEVRGFPEYLRAAGYYTSNNSKEDYNFTVPAAMWHESSPRAHWRKRTPGQPFFSVFNLMVTHQSQIFVDERRYRENTKRLTPKQRRDPSQVPIPPIHPDSPEFRRDWARHYENVTAMDYQVGDILAELEADGLADNTIVFFFSDHGTGMPGIKMWAWGASLNVPLLVRFPSGWQRMAPAAPGEVVDRLVSFVDFAPTVLGLAGVTPPEHFQGSAFLGSAVGLSRAHIFAGKDRQSELTDSIRSVRDSRFQYLRNFRPHQSYGQYMSYNWQAESMRAWERLHDEGKLSGAPARFFAPGKAVEELYEVERDPWQVHNLAADPAYAGELVRMRGVLRSEMMGSHDLGLLNEYEMNARSKESSPYEIAADPRLNPLETLMAAADLASARDVRQLPALRMILRHEDSAVRWWGAVGFLALREEAAPAKEALLTALSDVSPEVRIAAAESLCLIGASPEALPVLRDALGADNVFVRLSALNAALRLGHLARPLLPAIAQAKIDAPGEKDVADYVARMVDYLPERLARRSVVRSPVGSLPSVSSPP